MKILPPASEGKLLEIVTGFKGGGAGHYVLYFHLSGLMENYKSEYQLKIAVNVLHDLFRDQDGTIALMQDADLVVIYPHGNRGMIEKAIFQLRYLFVDDPLAYDVSGEENRAFCTVYDLGFQWHDVHDLMKARFMGGARNRDDFAPLPVPDREASGGGMIRNRAQAADYFPGGSGLQPLNLSRLAMIEGDLRRTDLSPAFRRQPICVVMKNGAVKPVFEEIYVNIPHLRKIIGTNVDFTANKGLFKYLTEALDLHVLSVLGQRAGIYLRSPVSININIETIFSSAFQEFDQRIKKQTKASVILEIHASDIFADMNAYIAARNLAHNMGYRVCVDGLSRHGFIQLDRDVLDFDMIKLLWNADTRSALRQQDNRPLIEEVKRIGPARVILCRCDGSQAIEYGQELGITMFQGRYTDRILDPSSQIVN